MRSGRFGRGGLRASDPVRDTQEIDLKVAEFNDRGARRPVLRRKLSVPSAELLRAGACVVCRAAEVEIFGGVGRVVAELGAPIKVAARPEVHGLAADQNDVLSDRREALEHALQPRGLYQRRSFHESGACAICAGTAPFSSTSCSRLFSPVSSAR